MKYCCNINDVRAAMKAIRPYVHRTPLMTCTALDKMAGRKLFFKTENFQKTGSFKIRGATNAIINLQKQQEKPSCVVTESCGNHGQSLAKAAKTFGFPCYVVMPEWTTRSKINAVKGYGAQVFLVDEGPEARENKVEELVEKYNGVYIKDTQNPNIIAGQGTIAMEILEQNPDIDVIVASVGGGAFLSGVAIAAKALKPSIKVIAAEPENANDCYRSKLAGELIPDVDDPDTIADGVRLSVGSNPWPIIRDLVDDVITVTEQEIKDAMFTIWERAKLVIEPTAGVSVAAVMSGKFKKIEGENVAVILCGGNVDISSLPGLIESRGKE